MILLLSTALSPELGFMLLAFLPVRGTVIAPPCAAGGSGSVAVLLDSEVGPHCKKSLDQSNLVTTFRSFTGYHSAIFSASSATSSG